MSATRYDAIVIGAGTNGLAAATRLGRAGKRVLVVERSSEIGGQTRPIEFAPGFRAPISDDAGWVSPSVCRALGIDPPAKTSPATSVSVAHDGGFFAVPRDVHSASAAIARLSSKDAGRWASFAARANKLSTFLGALYELPPPDVATKSITELASLIGVGRKFRALGRADMTELLRVMPMSAQDFLDDEFENAALKAAVGAGAVRDLRQGPRSGGTTFNLLHYLVGAPAGSVRARDWWAASPTAFVDAIATAAKKNGATIRTGAEVARIRVENDTVNGVGLANGEGIDAPLVLSTADPYRTMLGLVDPVWLDPEFMLEVRNIKFRGCTTIVAYALDALPDTTADLASVVSLSPTLDSIERAYDASKYREVSAAPHVELFAPTLRWSGLAPEGKHVVVARAQYTPYDVATDSVGDTVTSAIERAMPGFTGRIKHRRVLTPKTLEREFGVTNGALTHGELTLDQILFMRPIAGLGRYAMPIDGLYVGGRGASPGPGILGGAGALAARAALE